MTFQRIDGIYGINKYIKAKHAHPRRRFAAIKPTLDELREILSRAMIGDPLEGIVTLNKAMMKWQEYSLVKNLIEYLDGINYGKFNEQIMALRVLQRHFEMGNLDPNEFTPEEAREFTADYAGQMIAIIQSL